MKKGKLLEAINAFFDSDVRKLRDKRKNLKELLKELRKKEKKLAKKVQSEDDGDKRTELEKDLDLIHAQRKKGVRLLKELKH